MALPRYLALTSEEFAVCQPLPKHVAWMACHFSPYGTGLVNLPPALPAGSMIILNDRIPMAAHDPDTVARQLRALHPHCLLLDFQRPPEAASLKMTRRITDALSCPVAAPAAYCWDTSQPLFLPLPMPDTPLRSYLAPWQGREIWLELGANAMTYTVTEHGSIPGSLSSVPESGHADRELCCHYRIDLAPEGAVFSLWQTAEDLEALVTAAKAHGVTKTVGLWQEFGS